MKQLTAVAAQSQQQTNLPPFTEVIKIEVEVNAIFEKLLSQFPEDYKHRENVAHAIVGSAVTNGSIGYIYNALNGYTNDIDFKIGDHVYCTAKERYERYDANLENERGESSILQSEVNTTALGYKPNWKRRSVEIQRCEVVDINLYADKKLKVRFTTAGYSGDDQQTIEWVNHKDCTHWHLMSVGAE